jgi:TIR domain
MIFISYARTPLDRQIATLLETSLTAAGLEVWRDTTQIQVGESFEKEIREAIPRASWIIFLVSNSWLDGGWCQEELRLALHHHGGTSKCLPVLRAPLDRIGRRMPVPFATLNATIWTEDEVDPGARLFELYARITGENVPAVEWSARGKALLAKAGLAPGGAPPPPPPAHLDPPSFNCDRAPQWSTVAALLGSGRHDLAIVRGPSGEYHEHFLDRVTRALPLQPERTIVPVRWQRRPVGRDDFLRALTESLQAGDPSRLPDHIRQRLAQRHLVLVHGCIRGDFEDDDLEQYYGTWLPELVAGHRGPFHLKCVQALEWRQEALIKRLLGWGAANDDDNKSAAERLVQHIETRQQSLTVVRLRELEPITSQELQEFCDAWVPTAHRAPLLAAVKQSAKTSEETLRAIDRYLLTVRAHEQQSAGVEAISR